MKTKHEVNDRYLGTVTHFKIARNEYLNCNDEDVQSARLVMYHYETKAYALGWVLGKSSDDVSDDLFSSEV